MKGLIMDYPLTLTHFYERARRLFAQEAARHAGARSGRCESYTYADWADRVARLAGGAGARSASEPGDRVGHPRVELAPPPGGVLRGAVDGRGAPHREPPPVAAGHHLHRQPRRGPRADRGREPAGPSWSRSGRASRPCGTSSSMSDTPDAEIPPGTLDYEALLARRDARRRTGPGSRRPTPPACATRRARRAIPRASSTPTAASSCTRWRRPWRTRSASPSAT